jgi:predicted MPP superfamily phosphohydrolase
VCISGVSFLSVVFLRFYIEHMFARIVVIISSVWLGILLTSIAFLISYDLVRFFIPLNPFIAGQSIIILVSVLSLIGILNTQIIRTKVVEIKTRKLDTGLKVVHLSDLHLGYFHGFKYFKRIIDKVKTLDPDIVLITGDLVDDIKELSKDFFSKLKELDSPIFYTTGNHDHYAGLDEVLNILKNTKIKVLQNESIVLKNLQIIGVNNGPGRQYVIDVLKSINIDLTKFIILMYHQPANPKKANKFGVDLMLAGHTHGGQFLMFILFARLFWIWSNGLYHYKNTFLYTSPGVGIWGPPFRLGTSNEITLIRVLKND